MKVIPNTFGYENNKRETLSVFVFSEFQNTNQLVEHPGATPSRSHDSEEDHLWPESLKFGGVFNFLIYL